MSDYGLEPEEGYYPPDFKEYMARELVWSRLQISGIFWKGFKLVFWSPQDDYSDRPLYYDVCRDIPVIWREDGSDGEGVVLHCMKWGLIPSFTKNNEKPGRYKMIPGGCGRDTIQIQRWKRRFQKQHYHIYFKDGRPLVFASLYDTWRNSEEFSLAVGRYQRCLKEIRPRACDYVDEKKGIKITKKEWENHHVHIASYNNFPTAAGFACLDSKLLGSSMKGGEVAENALTVTEVGGNLNQEPST